MPTPFTHLRFANQILSELPAAHVIQARRGDFLLGSVAPDLSSIDGLRRDETHFFALPPQPHQCGPFNLLRRYPQFAHTCHLSAASAAFISGYLAHLLADEIWLWRIFVPYFVLGMTGDNAQDKLMIHNAIRTYIDRDDRATLDAATRVELSNSTAIDVLPFVSPRSLTMWKQMLCTQLVSGAAMRTLEVFARQIGVTPQALENCLNEELTRPNEVFRVIVPHLLSEYQREVIHASKNLVTRYLNGAFAHNRLDDNCDLYHYDEEHTDWHELARNWHFIRAVSWHKKGKL